MLRIAADYDRLAQQFADDKSSFDALKAVRWLAGSGNAFTDKSISNSLHARRAERLVLALDRLAPASVRANSAVDQSLNKLFADAQSLPDFDPNQFAKDLNTFHSSVAGFLETK